MSAHNAEYVRGYKDGLERAARYVMSAPLLSHGQRQCDVPGGVPRVMDSAVNPHGDPNLVCCNYALRDAIPRVSKFDLSRTNRTPLGFDGQREGNDA